MFGTKPPKTGSLLILGRVWNLPTVWSDCLAAWWLAGDSNFFTAKLLGLLGACLTMSLFYLAGMFLNDAFDADYDGQRRVTKPIPSGQISAAEVWFWGISLLVTGICLCAINGMKTLILGGGLALSILLYNAVHRAFSLSPLLMGLCRFMVYLIAASGAARGIVGDAIWAGLALGAYVAGTGFLARSESNRGSSELWPLIFLGAPLGLAWLVNDGFHPAWALIALSLTAWMVWTLRRAFWMPGRNIGYTVSQLLAGIVIARGFRLIHFSSSEVYGDWPNIMVETVMDEQEIKDAMGVMRKHQPMAFHHVSKMSEREKDVALVALGKKLCAARKDVLGLIK